MSRVKLKVGDAVRVTKTIDEACPLEFVGHVGVVVDFNTNNQTGNDESNPLIEVAFRRRIYYASHGRKRWDTKYAFWREELRFVR